VELLLGHGFDQCFELLFQGRRRRRSNLLRLRLFLGRIDENEYRCYSNGVFLFFLTVFLELDRGVGDLAEDLIERLVAQRLRPLFGLGAGIEEQDEQRLACVLPLLQPGLDARDRGGANRGTRQRGDVPDEFLRVRVKLTLAAASAESDGLALVRCGDSLDGPSLYRAGVIDGLALKGPDHARHRDRGGQDLIDFHLRSSCNEL
jgi:hypothetical protein